MPGFDGDSWACSQLSGVPRGVTERGLARRTVARVTGISTSTGTTSTGAPPAPADTPVRDGSGVECLHCETSYDPIASRWLCPGCKQKTVTCCEGAPLPECRPAG
ncbi:MAG: hypothetical protein QOE01_2455 [Actinomycetota bacterium]|jgi:hypothetical protein|nr:hypothetical protein [Actinomycetota bacterium]